MARLYRSAVTSVAVFAMIASNAAPAFAAPPMTRAQYEACQSQSEDDFRKAIERVAVSALEGGLRHVDYQALVAEQWREGNVGDIVDKRVDIAVAEVRDETSWAQLLQSLAYKEQAQKLATDVAERVYRSDAMKTAIENLAAGVGAEVGRSIEIASRDAAEPALQCLQAYLGPRYGKTVAAIVREDASRDFALSSEDGGAEVTAGKVLSESGGGIAGAAILLVRRQLANLARNIGQRIVGSVLSRLVSVVAGGVGLVLIAKDIWDLRHGVLPIIASEMKSDATKEKVQEELARSIAEQIGLHVKEIGVQSANRVVEVWREYRSAHLKALEIAERDASFRQFLDSLRPERMGRLDAVVGLVLAAEGEAGVLRRLQNGTLNEAVNRLPEPAMDIAHQTRSLEQALKWSAVAGEDIGKVAGYGIYRVAKPDDFTESSLQRVLSVGDEVAINRLASVKPDARATLFDLPASELKALARGLNASELSTLSGYLTGLEKGPRETVLRAVAASPGKMQFLASDRVRNAVVASSDQQAAVDMMLQSSGAFKPVETIADFRLAWEGRVSPMLIVEKHPITLIALAVVAFLLLLMLRRLFTGGPRRRAPEGPPTEPAGKGSPERVLPAAERR